MVRHRLPQEHLIEPFFHLVIDGKDLTQDMEQYVTKLDIEYDEDKLNMATFEVDDYDGKWAKGSLLTKGKSLNVTAGHMWERRVVFRGKITHIEGDFNEGEDTLKVHAISTGVMLMNKRTSKTWTNKKVSEVVTMIHKNAGINIICEDTKTVFPEVPQVNETGAEFTHRWRKKLGWEYIERDDGFYYFGPKGEKEKGQSTLGYRTGNMAVISFNPSYKDIQTEEEKSEKEIDSKDEEPKESRYKIPAPKGNGKVGTAIPKRK